MLKVVQNFEATRLHFPVSHHAVTWSFM